MKQDTLYHSRNYALAISMLIGSLQAQTTQPKDTTMNRTVVVEQEYNPDIMDASKVNVPAQGGSSDRQQERRWNMPRHPDAGNFRIPAGIMQAYTGKETQAKALPGYVRLRIR